MRILLVTPFAPYRDGIAAYALQELRRLRTDGHLVEVCSPLPSAARWHLPLGGPAGMAKLVALAGDHDRVVLQLGPELAFGRCRTAAQRVAVWGALAALARRRPLEVRIHEIEYGPLDQNPLERRAARLALGLADRVTVHTQAERATIGRCLGIGPSIELIDHGLHFQPAIDRTRPEARRLLGLPEDGIRFVAIGFLQRHKGFDRAIDAIERLNGPLDGPAQLDPRPQPHLDVVGSARVDHPEIRAYVDELRGRCAQVANATLHEGYVSDVDFDLWLQAADAVVLPYREIWSSGVLERARLFATPILASDLPQLRDQAPADTLFFADADELSALMDKLRSAAPRAGGPVAGLRPPASPAHRNPAAASSAEPWAVDPSAPDRADLQRQIASRARASAIDQAVGAGSGPDRRAVDGLVRLGPLHRPQPTSARPGVAPLKRVVARITNWRIDPLAARLEELQRATTDAVAQLETRIDTPEETP